MLLTVAEIAEALGVEPLGDAGLQMRGLAEPALAGPEDLALAMSRTYLAALARGQARAAVVPEGTDWQALGLLAAVPVGRPRLAMSTLTTAFDPGPGWAPGVHPSAIVEDGAMLGIGTSVGAFGVIGAGAVIGADCRIGDHVSIAAGAVIGDGALIHPGTRIGPRVRIGGGFIAQPNAVVGSDGFSFVTAEVSAVETARATLVGDTAGIEGQEWQRIASLGGVEIGDDVELGALSAIDSGTIRPTRIGDGTKIDNMVHVAHNVVVGRHCLLCGQVGIAGSTVIGDFVVLGGQSGVVDNITVGDRVIAGAGSKLLSNVPAGRVVQGYPAVRMETHVESYKALRRLPRLMERLRAAAGDGQNAVSKPREND
ncbi:UDP-3-O-(3-hydroxymyristoyl)glucosamine N-acyltransferase [Frigidibacter sp. ROC022]|uniref:UDP-3-O-(3-hydroxymyristoyl)glucosamine N-acyltransferase n=1 Tax=Frigidibacter sp. ROC022 TaxID=2971796 RepID=UPI00215A1841|nr:UDP-3-O-(3-hydroxymyristoyl)glucosamine N-acyltransferase [Frigidibacter sp. ROC022]MCR8723938.1 UDP-3-O-(3-hydroxymyristoyl)glucosamine N-acyltransferase [Frigidibacter sp. ROC022]